MLVWTMRRMPARRAASIKRFVLSTAIVCGTPTFGARTQ